MDASRYKLPLHIAKHVDFVTPGVKLSSRPTQTLREPPSKSIEKREEPTGTFAPMDVNALNLSTCDKAITPECIKALYKIPTEACAPQPGNDLGIFEQNSTYVQSDMDVFFADASPKIPKGTQARNVLLHGAEVVRKVTTETATGVLESNLDFQLAWPIVYPQNITLFDASFELPPDAAKILQGDNDTAAMALSAGALAQSLDTTLDALDGSYCGLTQANRSTTECGTFKPPTVLSISFGAAETALPVREQLRLCWEFLKLGLRGTSVLVASGDNGVASRNSQTGQAFCAGPQHTLFTPSYLSSCPYITSVGATAVVPGNAVTDPESAALELQTNRTTGAQTVQFASGGGFSNRIAMPWYQRDAVAAYLRDHPPPFASYDARKDEIGASGGVFNRAGRAFPDVSAVGDRVLEAVHGQFRVNAGTSASAPIFASIVTRINGERLAAGKKAVGFLNPVLYKHADAFNDVVNGTNPGCGTVGFAAAKGWDPVTGLGTPDYGKLRDVFMKLP